MRSGLTDGAFSAHFQPKFDPESEEIASLEAFLRWQHPSEGLRAAGWFMPSVERSEDLAQSVDAWMLNAVTRQGRAWLDDKLPFGVLSVNISAWGSGDQLVAMVKQALKSNRFPAKSLALECPWRMFAADAAALAPTMTRLRDLGCAVVLDGNPLDQECLEMIGKTPVKLSKVCIGYIEDFSRSHGEAALSALIKAWGRHGVQIVSVGVEQDEQAELSRRVGCRYTQGNRFKSPLPADEVTFLLTIIKKTKKALTLI